MFTKVFGYVQIPSLHYTMHYVGSLSFEKNFPDVCENQCTSMITWLANKDHNESGLNNMPFEERKKKSF